MERNYSSPGSNVLIMANNEQYKLWHKPHKEILNVDGNLKKGTTHQGYLHEKYNLQVPGKYIGNPRLIIYRSGWELAFCRWCDRSPSILRWSSEPIRIPYYDRVSNLSKLKGLGMDPNNPKNWVTKFYNTDFWVQVKKADETIERWFIEIKPRNKLGKPVPPESNAKIADIKRYNNLVKEYLINEAKFAAISEWARKNGASFYIFTEDQLRKYGIINN
jgi:hypothetical protein